MKSRLTYVTISTLALTASYGQAAYAQLAINCTRPFSTGQHVACSNGSLTINPDGSVSLAGCLITITPPQAGQCVITAGALPTRSVRAIFTAPAIAIDDGGGNTAIVNNMRMMPVGETLPQIKYTFAPTEVTNTVTLNIGGRLNFTNGQAIGNYTGNISVSVNLN